MSHRTTRSPGLRHALRRAATAVAAAALVCGPAAAAATAAPAHSAPVHSAPVHSAPAESTQQFLHLTIDSVTPQMVQADSPPQVTIVGSVANVGDRDVSDVQVRLQRASRIAEADQLRTALKLNQDSYSTVGQFQEISALIKQGATSKFTLSMPVRSDSEESLEITEPGVYPMLVNVNGTPDYGGPARLDDARFLVPVLAVPANAPADPATAPQPPVFPPAAAPVPMTMLYPLANTPKIAAGVPGQPPGDSTGAMRLVDDTLADSLAPGGRLFGMLAALDDAIGPDAVPQPAVAPGLCLAIDPDLLVTVEGMTRGYLVTTDPANPAAAATPGAGRDAAAGWLERLRKLAAKTCTVAVPYAQSELDAVIDVENPVLASAAVTAPTETVNRILGTDATTGMLWPSTGQLEPGTASALPGAAPTTLMLAANATSAGAAAMRLPDLGPLLSATSFDVPAAAALAASGAEPGTPSFVPEALRYPLEHDSRAARLQDSLGALAWPAIPAAATGTAAADAQPPASAPAPVLVAPPQLWSVDHDEAAAVLAAYQGLIANGLVVARPLAEVIAQAAAPDAAPASLVDPVPGDSVGDEPDQPSWPELTGEVEALIPRLTTLRGTIVDVPNATLNSGEYLLPLVQDLLRTLTTAGRDGNGAQAAQGAAQTRIAALNSSLASQFAGITLLAPGSNYTLASSQSPLLLVAKNDLPVPVRVHLDITAPEGVNILSYDDYVLPARGSRQIQVPAEIEFSRQIDLRVGLLAPDGTPFGEKIHISLQSNAYGYLIPIVTGIFGALLLFLAGRRAWHRIKGRPDPSDERRPVITPPDKPGIEG